MNYKVKCDCNINGEYRAVSLHDDQFPKYTYEIDVKKNAKGTYDITITEFAYDENATLLGYKDIFSATSNTYKGSKAQGHKYLNKLVKVA